MPWVEAYPWTNEITLEFIKHYKREPCLWDPSHRSHKNRIQLFYAWERIKTALQHKYDHDYSTDDLKKKKETLLTTFRLHMRRKQKNPKYVPIWYYYEALEKFLGPIYFGDGKETTNVTRASTSSPDKSATLQNIKTEIDHETPRMSMNSNYAVTSDSDEMQEYDECDLFAELVARKLRRLNQHDRDLVMHEIDNLMFDARRKHHTTNSSDIAITVEDHKIVIENNYDDNAEYLEEHVVEE